MKSFKMILVLTVMGLISGGALAAVYKTTAPVIKQNKLEELKRAILKVLPKAKSYDKQNKDGITYYDGKDIDGTYVGRAFKAVGSGFQDKITMMVGIDTEMKKLQGMYVLDQTETPGLGAKITDKSFRDQFTGLSVLPEITYVKNKKASKPNEVEAITAATISTVAVVKIINEQYKAVKAASAK